MCSKRNIFRDTEVAEEGTSDQVPGKKREDVELKENNYGIDKGHVAKDKEKKRNLNVRKEEKSHKRMPDQNSKVETIAPENLNLFEKIRPSIALYKVAIIWMLIYDRPLSVTIKKKTIAFVILMSMQYLMVAGSPIQHTHELAIGFEYKLLKTSHCDRIGFWKYNQCERNEKLFKIYIDACGWANKCDPGFKPTCVQGDEGEALHFCTPAELSCKAGYRRKARKKGNDLVIVQEEKCPIGWYQPSESDCYNACGYSHGDLKKLPEQYAIYYNGDNTSPPLIFCDFKRGFYSHNGIFLYKYDNEMKYNSFECRNVNEYNPCSSGKITLPDGSCISRCETGYTRDEHDGFKCKEIHDVVYQTDKKIDAKDVDEYETLLESQPNVTTPADYTNTQDWHVRVVIVLLIVALLLVIASIITIYNSQNDRLAIGDRFYKRMCRILANEELPNA